VLRIDQPYILAFSLIMLHTDAFNKSNKSKMTKADYIRNTRIDGVPSEILDCLFDNIVFSPFIFVEEDMDGGSIQSVLSTPPLSSADTTSASSAFFNLGSSTRERGKVDPYFLITKGLIHELKAEIELRVPWKSAPLPLFRFSYPTDVGALSQIPTRSPGQSLSSTRPSFIPPLPMPLSSASRRLPRENRPKASSTRQSPYRTWLPRRLPWLYHFILGRR
jgi:hypothetical protein